MQSQNQDWRARARKRFQELAVKEALNLLSEQELAKLERYSILFRKLEGRFYSTPRKAFQEWQDKMLDKHTRECALKRSGLITPEDFLSAPNKSTWTTYVVKNSVFSTALGKTEDAQIIVD